MPQILIYFSFKIYFYSCTWKTYYWLLVHKILWIHSHFFLN